jgi:hypothetical protein
MNLTCVCVQNVIHDSSGVGVTVSEFATPSIVANDIFRHHLDGIVVCGGADREYVCVCVCL